VRLAPGPGIASAVTTSTDSPAAGAGPVATTDEAVTDGGPGGEAHGDEHGRRRLWSALRLVVSLALLGAAAYFIVGRASEVAAAWHLLGHLLWRWIALAVLFEAASMVVFARMQRWLLRAGGVRVPLGTMVEITLAGNAMAATLPGGVAWAGAWVFGQLRRRGVSRFLRVWMFLVAGAVSSFALFLVVVAGIELAGDRGPVAGLRWGALALAALPVAAIVGLALGRRTPLRLLGRRLLAPLRPLPVVSWPAAKAQGLIEKIRAVRLSRVAWAEVLGLGLLNWLDDCAVLVCCMAALGVGVPWRGIFVVYGLTQVAAALPITPGGIGVVEGTLGALLHAYGVPLQEAVATVIVYRIVSFWGLVPIGWAVWVGLDVLERRGHRAGRAHPWAEHLHGQGGPEPAPWRRPRLMPDPRPCPASTQCRQPGAPDEGDGAERAGPARLAR
jgi:uncharacterized membrane protein YbhN (UPF0104 family)